MQHPKSEERNIKMKKVSILVPTYYEEDNVIPLSEAIVNEFKALPEYDYEIVFIDNDSKDKTRPRLLELCKKNPKIKAIFNAKNFGQFNSPFYGMLQTTGDCTILMSADFQDPVEMIPKFIREWEKGYKIVSGIKATSKENKIMRFLRTCYYKLIKKMSNVEQIEHFTGFGLYDKSFMNVLRELDDPMPFLRGIVAELGFRRKEVIYEQPKRRAGKTSNNFFTLYDAAMLSFTSYTKIGMRIATIIGFLTSFVSIMVGLVYFILKLCNWNGFQAGNAPILIGVFILGGVQMFFTGMLGEYVLNINSRILKRPLVVEETRLNFEGYELPDEYEVAGAKEEPSEEENGDGEAAKEAEENTEAEESAENIDPAVEAKADDEIKATEADAAEMEATAETENAVETDETAEEAKDVSESEENKDI